MLIRLAGPVAAIKAFEARLPAEAPSLARIDTIERHEPRVAVGHDGFLIAASAGGIVATSIVPDAGTCAACIAEIGSPKERRFRYGDRG